MRKLLPFVLSLFVVLALGASTATAANQSPFGSDTGNYADQLVVMPDGGNNVVLGIEDQNGQTQAAGLLILNGPSAAASTSSYLYADNNGVVRGHLTPGSYAIFYGLSHGESAGRTQLSGWLDVSESQVILHFAPIGQSQVELVGGIIYLMF